MLGQEALQESFIWLGDRFVVYVRTEVSSAMVCTRFVSAAALAVCSVFLALPAPAQQAQPMHVRGVIAQYAGNVLTVERATGPLAVELPASVGVRVVERASFAQIKPGSYIGATAVTQPDGSLRAVEIHIFPPALRGTGEGHRPWDLQASSTMTNATVTNVESATVAGVAKHTLTLTYQGGEKQIVVPDDIPIVSFTPGDAMLLKPGVRVFLTATKNGESYSAASVTVGKDGVAPPM
jgi:hypothetical protein